MRGFGDPEKKYDDKIVYSATKPFKKGGRKDQLITDIMLACDRNQDQKLNFNEYMQIRGAILAWMQCVNQIMNRSGLKCALSTLVPDRRPLQAEADVVFRLGQKLMNDTQDRDISFPVFLMILDLYKVFSVFNIPLDSGYLSESEMRRQLAELELSNRVSDDAIREVFRSYDHKDMNFYTFGYAV